MQEIHLDVSGPIVPTLTDELSAVHFVDAFTAKSDIDFVEVQGRTWRRSAPVQGKSKRIISLQKDIA